MKKLILFFMCAVAALMCVAAQCQATTKKGTQCKRQASPDSSYCWQHGGTTKAQRAAGMTADDVAKMRCKATTKAGTQCKRTAQAGSDYCWQHAQRAEGTNAVSSVSSAEVTPSAATKSVTNERTQCTATTKKGTRCTRKAQPGSDKCWQHQ